MSALGKGLLGFRSLLGLFEGLRSGSWIAMKSHTRNKTSNPVPNQGNLSSDKHSTTRVVDEYQTMPLLMMMEMMTGRESTSKLPYNHHLSTMALSTNLELVQGYPLLGPNLSLPQSRP